MLLFAPKETQPGENRVAITPDSAKRLAAVGIDAAIEAGAGLNADYPDKLYERRGRAHICGRAEGWALLMQSPVSGQPRLRTLPDMKGGRLAHRLAGAPWATKRGWAVTPKPTSLRSRLNLCRASAAPKAWTHCPAKRTWRAMHLSSWRQSGSAARSQ